MQPDEWASTFGTILCVLYGKHLHGWHAAGGNITSDPSQFIEADVARWSAAMCVHLLQWRCADPQIFSLHQSASFINNLHMHLQHCALLGPQSVNIHRYSTC